MRNTSKNAKVKEVKEVEANILAIATLVRGKDTVGLRVINTNDKEKYKDVPMESIKKVLASGAVTIKNIDLVNGEVIGSNGSLNRLAKVDIGTGKLVGLSPLVVVLQLGDVGYRIVDYKGEIKNATKEFVVAYAKEFGIANGKEVTRDGVEFISSINGEYARKEISKSKLGNVSEIRMSMSMGTDEKKIAANAKIDVDNSIDEKDVFRSMTLAQKKTIQDFYVWYTVSIYKSMAKSVRININLNKAAKLAELRGVGDWVFGGIRDTGMPGGGKCELKHPVRYEYFANLVDKDNNVTGSIIFGETCSGEFFNISVEDMAKLVKIRKSMSAEIELMSEIANNKTYDAAWKDVGLLRDCVDRLKLNGTLNKALGSTLGNTVNNFIISDMPFPKSLVKLVRKVAYKSDKVEEGTGNEFWKLVFPENKDAVDLIYNYEQFNQKQQSLSAYVEFMAYNKLDGVYAYDPFNKVCKEEGGFNQKTREHRNYILRLARAYSNCSLFTFDEIESLLQVVSATMHGYKVMSDVYGDKEKMNDIEFYYSKRCTSGEYSAEMQEYLKVMWGCYFIGKQYAYRRYYRTRGIGCPLSASYDEKTYTIQDSKERMKLVYKPEFKTYFEKLLKMNEDETKAEEDDRIARENAKIAEEKVELDRLEKIKADKLAEEEKKKEERSKLSEKEAREEVYYNMTDMCLNPDNTKKQEFFVYEDLEAKSVKVITTYKAEVIDTFKTIIAYVELEFASNNLDKSISYIDLGDTTVTVRSNGLEVMENNVTKTAWERMSIIRTRVRSSKLIEAFNITREDSEGYKLDVVDIINLLSERRNKKQSGGLLEFKPLEMQSSKEYDKWAGNDYKAGEIKEDTKEDTKEDASGTRDEIELTENDVTELKELLVRNADKKEGTKTYIAKNIIERDVEFNKLSIKQKYILAQELKRYRAYDNGDEFVEEANDTVKLESDVQEKCLAIIKAVSEDEMFSSEVNKVDAIAVSIVKSVLRNGKCSERQMKHIDAVYKLIG